MKYIEADARIVNGYRYWLRRSWSTLLSDPPITWMMLNPSKAGPKEDDPTVRKVVGFSKRWGYGSVLIVNRAARIATDPRELRRSHTDDPEGIENPGWVWRAIHGFPVIVAWGDGVRHLPKGPNATLTLLEHVARRGGVYCLGRTRAGNPRHPARISYDTPRERWTP